MRIPTALLGLATSLLVPELAHAHAEPSSALGLVEGLRHPIAGWDHLLAMLAVGIWAATAAGPRTCAFASSARAPSPRTTASARAARCSSRAVYATPSARRGAWRSRASTCSIARTAISSTPTSRRSTQHLRSARRSTSTRSSRSPRAFPPRRVSRCFPASAPAAAARGPCDRTPHRAAGSRSSGPRPSRSPT